MTKHLPRQPLDKCMKQLNQHRAQGCAQAGLVVQGEGTVSTDPIPSFGAGVGEVADPNKPNTQMPSAGKPNRAGNHNPRALAPREGCGIIFGEYFRGANVPKLWG